MVDNIKPVSPDDKIDILQKQISALVDENTKLRKVITDREARLVAQQNILNIVRDQQEAKANRAFRIMQTQASLLANSITEEFVLQLNTELAKLEALTEEQKTRLQHQFRSQEGLPIEAVQA